MKKFLSVQIKNLTNACLLTVLLSVSNASFANSKTTGDTLSLDNLERERAALVLDMLNPVINSAQRAKNLAQRQRTLTDMERMVMRDTRLAQSNPVKVKKAFDQYNTTFLVHAGAEHNRSASEQWLASIQLSNANIMNSTTSFR